MKIAEYLEGPQKERYSKALKKNIGFFFDFLGG